MDNTNHTTAGPFILQPEVIEVLRKAGQIDVKEDGLWLRGLGYITPSDRPAIKKEFEKMLEKVKGAP